MRSGVESRGFSWESMDQRHWKESAEELIPVALRWKREGRQRVLDLGCGVGRNSLLLAELGFGVDAYDLSPEGVRVTEQSARERGLEVRGQVGDMLSLPYPEGAFDCVLAFHVVYHTDMPGLRTTISQIRRLLKPGGELFVTFNSTRNPAFRDPSNRVVGAKTVVKTRGVEAGIPHTYVDVGDVRELLSAFELRRLQLIQEFFDDTWGWHFFVQAVRPTA